MRVLLLTMLTATCSPALAMDEPALAIPARNPQGMQVYRAEHLHLEPVTSWSYHNHSVGFMSHPGYGWGTFFSLGPTFVTPHHEWLVIKGPAVMDVPSFLTLTGETERHEDLLKKVRRNKRYSVGLGGVAALGAVALVAGLFTEVNATSPQETFQGVQMYNYGAVGLASGLVLASIPMGRAKLLLSQPGSSMSPDEAAQIIREHNDGLRHALGLTPAEAFEIEQGDPRP
jgi:hypothetical protein